MELRLTDYKPCGEYECGCRSCDRIFASNEAFDRHLTGAIGSTRNCAENPATRGLVLDSKGRWKRPRTTQGAMNDK